MSGWSKRCRRCAARTGNALCSPCLGAYRRSVDYRGLAMRRYGPNCRMCPQWINRHFRRRLEVDHRKALALGGTHAVTNLQVLCRWHHSRKTRADIARMRGHRWQAFTLRHLTGLRWKVLLVVVGYLAARQVHAAAMGGRLAVVVALGVTVWVLVALLHLILPLRLRR